MSRTAVSNEGIDPEEYVSENSDQLAFIIKHSNDQFIRGLCLAALVKYGQGETGIDQIKKELDHLQETDVL